MISNRGLAALIILGFLTLTLVQAGVLVDEGTSSSDPGAQSSRQPLTYIDIQSPSADGTKVDKEFIIEISARSQNVSEIFLYYMETKGESITPDNLINTAHLEPDQVTGHISYTWVTTLVPSKDFWILGILNDTTDSFSVVDSPYKHYSPFRVSITHAGSNAVPTGVVLNPVASSDITESSVKLTWSQNEDPDFLRYEVHKSTSANFVDGSTTLVTNLAAPDILEFIVKDLDSWTTYYFKIKVADIENKGNLSNEVMAETDIVSDGMCCFLIIVTVVIVLALIILVVIVIIRRRRAQKPVTDPDLISTACVACGKTFSVRKSGSLAVIRCPYCGREGQMRFSH